MIQPFLTFGSGMTPLGPTRLDPPEIESHSPDAPAGGGTPSPLALDEPDPREKLHIETAFRHSGWAANRQRVYESLMRRETSLWRIQNFGCCGTNAWVDRSVDDPSQYRIRSDRCHDRFCLPCGQERSRIIAHNVKDRLRPEIARFITLTLRASHESLKDLLDKLYTSFTKLRRTCLWSQTQLGGVAFLEVKWCKGTHRWHPHLHILTEGKYLAKQALSNAWRKATGGSFIVDVGKVKSAERAIGYIVKYASKPHDPSLFQNADRLDEAVIAMKGRRLALTFGTWRGVKLCEVPDPGEWAPFAPLAHLILEARDGDPHAAEVLRQLPGNALASECRDPPDDFSPDYPQFP